MQILPFVFDKGLKILVKRCPGLRKLCLIDVRDVYNHQAPYGEALRKEFLAHPEQDDICLKILENGLINISKNCSMLRELDLLYCADESVNSISGFQNLQILHLMDSIDEFNNHSFTDIELTKVGHNFKLLLKLALNECKCSYGGIAAIGYCCSVLEELILSSFDFFEGWIIALSFFKSMKCLRFEGYKKFDSNPGSEEPLGIYVALEKLHLRRDNLQDRVSFGVLALVSSPIIELELKDCWALDDEILMQAGICKKVRYLSLEGCSLVSTCTLESLFSSFKDLQRFKILPYNNIRDSEITPSVLSLFTTLEELQWVQIQNRFLQSVLKALGWFRKEASC